MSKRFALCLSCEHAENAVPDFLTERFESAEAKAALETHRGYDIGAKAVFDALAKILKPACALKGSYSRLAIDLNRNSNLHHRYSRWTEGADGAEKARLENHWKEFRNSFLQDVRRALADSATSTVLHLSIHSFTPVWKGAPRNADLGILYDPARKRERDFAVEWKRNLKEVFPELRVRFNYPYLGKTDGHATSLRKLFPETSYLGFEVEWNQAFLECAAPEEVARCIAETLPQLAD